MSEPSEPLGTIWLDCHITRRKTFHVLTDSQGRVQAKARALSTILRGIVDNGGGVVMLALEDEETASITLNLPPRKAP